MTGYEKPTIQGGGEHPDSWDHPKINEAFSPLRVNDAVNQADRYWQMSTVWEQGVETFIRSIQNSISQAWSGTAAEASKTSIQEYVDKQARPLTPGLQELYTRVRDAATAIENTKKALPDPVVVTWTSWAWPPHRWDLQREQSTKEQEARTAMAEKYVAPFAEIDSKIPVLQVPISPTHSVDIPVPKIDNPNIDQGGPVTPGGTSGGPSNSGGTDNGPQTSGTQSPDQTATTPSDTDGQSGTQTTPSSTNSTTDSTNPSSTSTDPTKTVSTSASPGSTTGTGTPGTTGLPGSSRTGSGRSGSGSGSPGSSSSPSPGRGVQNLMGSTGAAGATAASAGAAGRGASGMSGMPGAAGRGNKDEESTHGVPDYLINQQNTEELLGDTPPTIADGVIGSNPD